MYLPNSLSNFGSVYKWRRICSVFIPGSPPLQMNWTKSHKNVPVRVRYGCFGNLRVVSGCKEIVLLC